MATVLTDSPLRRIERRFGYNIDRVNRLVDVFAKLKDESSRGQDVLRAAVVLLHATLEDTLRGLLAWKLPDASPEKLDGICFDLDRRITRISVSDLAKHRSKTIQEYLKELVDAHLSRQSFNDCRDVANALKMLDIVKDDFEVALAATAPVMARRHKIVHESDRLPAMQDHGKPRTIRVGEARGWISAVGGLIRKVLGQLQKASDQVQKKPVRKKR